MNYNIKNKLLKAKGIAKSNLKKGIQSGFVIPLLNVS